MTSRGLLVLSLRCTFAERVHIPVVTKNQDRAVLDAIEIGNPPYLSGLGCPLPGVVHGFQITFVLGHVVRHYPSTPLEQQQIALSSPSKSVYGKDDRQYLVLCPPLVSTPDFL